MGQFFAGPVGCQFGKRLFCFNNIGAAKAFNLTPIRVGRWCHRFKRWFCGQNSGGGFVHKFMAFFRLPILPGWFVVLLLRPLS
jgi:hypothetical protein